MVDDLSLKQFVDMDRSGHVASYVAALEAFDGIAQLQELKVLARDRGGVGRGRSILDVGCGFGLETLRLAALAGPGAVAGLDKSADFIADAARRAAAAGLGIDFRVGDATALPWPAASFDCVRAERLLIYLDRWEAAVREMRRVARPGGGLAFIEPDFSTTTINLPDRPAVRRALAHETDTAVVESWLPGALLGLLRDLGLSDIEVATRVVVFPQDLGATYFAGVGRHAAEAGALSADELAAWLAGIAGLHAQGSAVRNGRLLPVHGAGVRRGDVVDPRPTPRVAAQDAAEREPAAPDGAMHLEGFERVGRAGRLEAAAMADPGREDEPVGADRQGQQMREGAHRRSSNGSAGASSGRQPKSSQVRAMCSGSGAVRVRRLPVIGWVRSIERACRCSLRLTPPPSCAPQPSPRFSWPLPPYLPSPTIGMADRRHVGAQLVGAAGHRAQRHPGSPVRRRVDHARSRSSRAWPPRWWRSGPGARRASSRPRRRRRGPAP